MLARIGTFVKGRHTNLDRRRERFVCSYEPLEPRQMLTCAAATGGIEMGIYGFGSPPTAFIHNFFLTSIAGIEATQENYVFEFDPAVDPEPSIILGGYIERDDGTSFFHSDLANIGIDILELDSNGQPLQIGEPPGIPGDAVNEAGGHTFKLENNNQRVCFSLMLTASANPSSIFADPGAHELVFRAHRDNTGSGNPGNGSNVVVPPPGATTDFLSVTLVVETDAPANNPPMATTDMISAVEDVILSGQLTAEDPDPGAVLTFELVGNQPNNGNISIEADGSFSYQTDTDNSTDTSFTYRVTDEFGVFDEQLVSITVESINDGPRFTTDFPSVETRVGADAVLIDPLAGLVDPEGDPIDTTTLQISTDPLTGYISSGFLQLSGDNVAQIINGHIVVTPLTEAIDEIFYRVMDDPAAGTPRFSTNDPVPSDEGIGRRIVLTVDPALPPAVPVFTGYVDDVRFLIGEIGVLLSGLGFKRSVTNDPSPLIRGMGEEGTELTLLGLPANVLQTSMIVSADGTWEIQIGEDSDGDGIPDAGLIPDGDYTIQVRGVKFGAEALSEEFEFSIDTNRPSTPSDIRLSVDSRPRRLGADEPPGREGFDSDGVTRNPQDLIFSPSVESGPAVSGISRYQIRLNDGMFEDVEIDVSTGNALFDLRDIYVNNTSNRVVIRTFDGAGNLSDVSRRLWVTFDYTSAVPDNIDVQTENNDDENPASPTRPLISLEITDQQYRVRTNQLTFQLFVNGISDRVVTSTIAASGGTSFDNPEFGPISISFFPVAFLAPGQLHELFVRVYDRAGNSIDTETVNYSSPAAFFLPELLAIPDNLSRFVFAESIDTVSGSSHRILVDRSIPLQSRIFVGSQYEATGNLVTASIRVDRGFEIILRDSVFEDGNFDEFFFAGDLVPFVLPEFST